MGKLLFLSTSLRSAPVAASVVAHAAVVLFAGFGGHAARGSTGLNEVEVDLVGADPVPVQQAPALTDEGTTAEATPTAAFPTHTHDYPVPPAHDAHPHDPSIVHDHAPLESPSSAAPDAVPPGEALAQAGQSVSLPANAPPVFTITLGSGGVATGGATSSFGTHTGSAGAAPSERDEAPVPESLVSTRARLLSEVKPPYPRAAHDQGVEADVGLEIVVDTTGAVADARVTRRAGYGMDEAAVAAVRRDRFAPAQRGGSPVRVRMPWVVKFHFN